VKANGTNSTDADFNQSVEAAGPQFVCCSCGLCQVLKIGVTLAWRCNFNRHPSCARVSKVRPTISEDDDSSEASDPTNPGNITDNGEDSDSDRPSKAASRLVSHVCEFAVSVLLVPFRAGRHAGKFVAPPPPPKQFRCLDTQPFEPNEP